MKIFLCQILFFFKAYLRKLEKTPAFKQWKAVTRVEVNDLKLKNLID